MKKKFKINFSNKIVSNSSDFTDKVGSPPQFYYKAYPYSSYGDLGLDKVDMCMHKQVDGHFQVFDRRYYY